MKSLFTIFFRGTLLLTALLFMIVNSALASAWFDIMPGADEYSVDFVMGVDPGESLNLGAYTLAFTYEGANIVNVTETPPDPLFPMPMYEDVTPEGTPFVAFTGAALWGSAIITDDTTLASFQFDGPAEVKWYDSYDSFMVQGEKNSEVFELHGRDLAAGGHLKHSYNAVPIPGAVWLLGTGLLGLFGITRKRATK